MTRLEESLKSQIRRDGPMPFAAFMQAALYHRRYGYYAGGRPRSTWRGDFVTSPELDPAFGGLWAKAFERVWEACGRPEEFDVIEVGPGEGSFAAAVLDSVEEPFGRALRYRLVEPFATLEQRQRETLAGRAVEWTRSITELPKRDAACVFANEVVDNLPVQLVERRDGILREVRVGLEQDAFCTTLTPASEPVMAFIERMGLEVREGHRAEVPLAAESFVKRAAAVFGKGALVVVDYGAEAAELSAKPRGTLLSYWSGGVGEDVLSSPGERDITAHVNWSVVRRACREAGLDVTGPTPQRDVLRSLGSADLDRDLKERYAVAVGAGAGAEAIRTISRRQALAALVDAGGLGGLGVMIATRGMPPSLLADPR